MTIPDEFITSPALKACTDAKPVPPSFLSLSARAYACVCVCVCMWVGVLIVPAADAHTTVRIIHANEHQRERFLQWRQARWASQAHCISFAYNVSRLRRWSCALLSAHSLMDATTSAADATSLKHVRRPKHNMATPRVETKLLVVKVGTPGAGKMLLVRHLTACRGCQSPPPSSPRCTRHTRPTSHDRPFVSLSCLAQIVKHPIDDVRDSAARRSLQGWSATARGTYICSAGTARRGRAIL